MSWTPVNGLPIQYSNSNNELASDYWLKLYEAGTTNPYSMATDSTGAVRLAKCKLNDDGYPITDYLDNTTVFVPHIDQNYRAVLYISEADADADNTANSAYNVDDLLSDASVAADISQITTRGTTLQAQDDYDRSPLFVDGVDFTAGLGPHVITVPVQVPAWTPNASDTRFYKLSTSGAVTIPDVTSSDATTFTLSDTLLSSDIIYLGDDHFRELSGGGGSFDKFESSNQHFNRTEMATIATFFDVQSVTPNTVETVGPTGSGADKIWNALDELPDGIKYIDIVCQIFIQQPAGTASKVYEKVWAWHPDIPDGNYAYFPISDTGFQTGGADNEVVQQSVQARIGVDSDKIFKVRHEASGYTITSVTLLTPHGFGI